MSSRTRLEALAHNSQDMTVADVHAVLGALWRALAEIHRSSHHVVPQPVADAVHASHALLGRELKRKLRRKLPESERQVTPTGRRLRVAVREWGDWTGRMYPALAALLITLDSAAEAAGLELYLFNAIVQVKDGHEEQDGLDFHLVHP